VLEQPEPGRLIFDVDELKIRELGIIPGTEVKAGRWDLLWMTETGHRNGIPRLRIRTTTSSELKVIITKESRGISPLVAMDNAASITYGFYQSGNTVVFDPFFSFEKSDGWRAQKVFIEVFVPENMPVEITDGLRKALDVRWYMRQEVSAKQEEETREQLTVNYCLPGNAVLLNRSSLPLITVKAV
jgi:hypothetical protein